MGYGAGPPVQVQVQVFLQDAIVSSNRANDNIIPFFICYGASKTLGGKYIVKGWFLKRS